MKKVLLLEDKRSKFRGERYKAIVPDTLDLAERANFALNALAGMCDPESGWEFWCFVQLVPPGMRHDSLSYASSFPKLPESFAMMRLITGSEKHLDVEKGVLQNLISSIGVDGLFYALITPHKRPWDNTSPEDYANIYGQARMLRSFMTLHQSTGDPVWMNHTAKMVRILNKIAIHKDDYVYYPTNPGYGDIFSYPKSGWKTTELLTSKQETMADMPDHTFGIPGYIGGLVQPLALCYEMFGNLEALELASNIVRFLYKQESGWIPSVESPGVTSVDRAHFRGHFHAHTIALRSILEYGIAANDEHAKQFARSGYEYARNFGIPALGWFEEYTGKFSCEGCCIADMTALGIRFTQASVADYWDDVNYYVRNHLAEAQFLSTEQLRHLNGNKLTQAQEEIIQRSIGSFAGWGRLTTLEPRIMHCCTNNCSQALYYVWDSMLEFHGGVAWINLLLNRASPWLDVDSYLPYDGKVVIKNKTAEKIFVRIPGWVDRKAVDCLINEKSIPTNWNCRYLVFEDVPSLAHVTIQFPQPLVTHKFNLFGKQYVIQFKGSTAIDISPRDEDGYQIYLRDALKVDKTPMKKVIRYVSPTRIKW